MSLPTTIRDSQQARGATPTHRTIGAPLSPTSPAFALMPSDFAETGLTHASLEDQTLGVMDAEPSELSATIETPIAIDEHVPVLADTTLLTSDVAGHVLLAQAPGASEFGAAIAEEMGGGIAGGAGAAAGGAIGAEGALIGLGAIAVAGAGGGGGGGGGGERHAREPHYTIIESWETGSSVYYSQPSEAPQPGFRLINSNVRELTPHDDDTGYRDIQISIGGGNYVLFRDQSIGSGFTSGAFQEKDFEDGMFAIVASNLPGDNLLKDDVLIVWNSPTSGYDLRGYVLKNLDDRTEYIQVENYEFHLLWNNNGISSIDLYRVNTA